MIKNNSKLVELETSVAWKVERRTRGADVDNGPHAEPTRTWILVLTNAQGGRRFVPEKRIFEQYSLVSTD